MHLRVAATWLALIAACGGDDSSGPDGSSGGDGDGDFGTGELGEVDPGTGSECLAYATSTQLTRGVQALDLVFAIEKSSALRDEQLALREQIPRLMRALTSGDADDDGTADFAPVSDLHVGVISQDLGLPGIDGIPQCSGLGDDGVLHATTSSENEGCSNETFQPPFLSYSSGDDVELVAEDFGCLAMIGTDGCGFGQPLESLLKAVWPADNMDVWFLPDPAGFGGSGQAGPLGANGDIVSGGMDGESLVAFVVVSHEDDCSMGATSHLAPDDGSLPDDSPLKQQGLNTRCFFEAMLDRDPSQVDLQNNLYGTGRYAAGLRALRPGAVDRVFFAAIVGVPPDLVEAEDLAAVDFRSKANSDAFYDGILADSRMIETLDDRGTAAVADDSLMPSCADDSGAKAYPPRRIVDVARRFGEHGVVQSICQDDLRPAIDAIVAKLGEHLGEPCLSRAHVRDDDGAVPCDVFWQLPIASTASDTIASCDERPFLTRVESLSSRGGSLCKVPQRVARSDDEIPSGDGEAGWYYDDFSAAAAICTGGTARRIAFTEGAEPPQGVVVTLRCLEAEYAESSEDDGPLACLPGSGVASGAHVGDPCLPRAVPITGFDDSVAYVEPVSDNCAGAACIVFHLGGDPREGCRFEPSPCVPDEHTVCPDRLRCATSSDVEESIYCSCRCDAPEGLPTCACPDNFSCVAINRTGPLNAQGSYCVRNSSVSH